MRETTSRLDVFFRLAPEFRISRLDTNSIFCGEFPDALESLLLNDRLIT